MGCVRRGEGIDECDMEEFHTLESSEKTIAVVGDRWWPQAAKQEGDKIYKRNNVIYGNNVTNPQMLEVSLLGVEKGMLGQWSND